MIQGTLQTEQRHLLYSVNIIRITKLMLVYFVVGSPFDIFCLFCKLYTAFSYFPFIYKVTEKRKFGHTKIFINMEIKIFFK